MLGKEHPETLMSMNNLATVLCDQGKYEEGELITRETMTLRETVLGKEHPSTLTSMNNLACLLNDQNKHEEAERIFRETLILRETVLGKEHPDTLSTRENLARVLRAQGKHEEAELIAAVRVTEQSETKAAACLAEDPASSESADVVRLSFVGTQEARHRAHFSKKAKGHERIEADGGDEEEGEEKGRRRARISRWAKKTVNSMKVMPLGSKKGHDHPGSTSESANPTRGPN